MAEAEVTKKEEKTPKSGLSRRQFLKVGAATAGVAVLAACGKSSTPTPTPTTTATATPTPTPTPTPTATPPPPAAEAYAFFDQNEAATIKAIFAQLIPGSPQDPGAVEAGAHIYLDRALAGFYSSQQETYRRGLAAVDAYSQSKYGNTFAKLGSPQQIAVLTDMQNGTATGFYAPTASAFFGTLNGHVKEGTFSDPIYGGNQNLVGWKMIGFPGAQIAYGDADMVIGADQSKRPIQTLADTENIPMPAPQSGF